MHVGSHIGRRQSRWWSESNNYYFLLYKKRIYRLPKKLRLPVFYRYTRFLDILNKIWLFLKNVCLSVRECDKNFVATVAHELTESHETLNFVAPSLKLVSAKFWWKPLTRWNYCFAFSRIFEIIKIASSVTQNSTKTCIQGAYHIK